MRVLIQQVKQASVKVEGKTIGTIEKGLLLFLGVHVEDSIEDCLRLKEKIIHLRIFTDTNGKMNLSLQDVGGDLLIVSQFTLYADCEKGRRPSFIQSARPEKAKDLYEHFIAAFRPHIKNVQTGEFGAHMEVELINNGPLTFIIDSKTSG